jgi:hypothetical protein
MMRRISAHCCSYLRLPKLRGNSNPVEIKKQKSPGGVALWALHLPKKHRILVRIPPGGKFFQGKRIKVYDGLICIGCVIYNEK